MTNPICPCGVEHYHDCCGRYHAGERPATPEALMRSRYSAFVLKLWPYLIETHHPDHLHGLTAQMLAKGPHPAWLALQVHDSKICGDKGEVFFSAWYRDDKRPDAICERSSFERVDGRWFYTSGEQYQPKFPGRNEPCICTSGKKAKQCCFK